MADLNTIDTVAPEFAKFYYTTFDTNRAGLQTLYRENSMLSFEGDKHLGSARITEKLVSLPFQTVKHQITTCDAQPFYGGGIAVLITGELSVDDAHPIKFTQSFNLMEENHSYYVLNDIFRLNYG